MGIIHSYIKIGSKDKILNIVKKATSYKYNVIFIAGSDNKQELMSEMVQVKRIIKQHIKKGGKSGEKEIGEI